MTKKILAEQILESLENTTFRYEKIEAIYSWLEQLEPKNVEHFAQWGFPGQISTPEDCWK